MPSASTEKQQVERSDVGRHLDTMRCPSCGDTPQNVSGRMGSTTVTRSLENMLKWIYAPHGDFDEDSHFAISTK